MDLSRFKKHAIACIACIVFFGLGIVSTVAYNYFASRDDVVFRNAIDNELRTKLLGSWLTDDLRTDEVERSTVEFKSSGDLVSQDSNFLAVKWTSMNGLIYISSKRIDGVQPGWKGLPDPVLPTFEETGEQLTFAFPGREPHLKLTRNHRL